MEYRIEDKTIHRFIEFLVHKEKDEKFVHILRAICICNEKPMMENQKQVSQRMLQDEATRKSLLFSIDFHEQNYFVSMNIPEYKGVGLWDLYNMSHKKRPNKDCDNGKTYNYFIAMIKLLSDLCKDRNYIAIDILQEKLEYEIIFGIMKFKNPHNKQGSIFIREAFTILLECLWIDVSPFQTIDLPYCIKIWDQLDDDSIFMEMKHNLTKYEPLKNYL